MIKGSLVLDDEKQGGVIPAVDPDADDAGASDLLEVIAHDSAERSEEPVQKKVARTTIDGPFVLESLYFRSFGERPLLVREEEIALAKRIDIGSRNIRQALRSAIKAGAKLKRTDSTTQSLRSLQMIRRLSGLSAVALDEALSELQGVINEHTGSTKASGPILRQITDSLITRTVSTGRRRCCSCAVATT